MPNQSLEHPDGTRSASLAVVTGRVTAAEPGAAFVQPDDPDGVSPVEFPALPDDRPDFLDGLDTVEEILAEARHPAKPPAPMVR